jgi:CDP-diacylglycerol--glycerol-3-phosphate 3-phosphatidyltransferase
MVLYIFAGITDMVDGPLARKLKIESKFGANLDGAADFLFAFIGLYRLLPVVDFPVWATPVVLGVISIRIASIIIAGIRFRRLVILHTIGNKTVVSIAWLLFIFYLFMDVDIILIIGCVVGLFAFIEDLIINSTSKEPDFDNKGLLFKKKV